MAVIAPTLTLTGCESNKPDDENQVIISVSTDFEAATPGQSITLVWNFSVAPDWHLYWLGRNDSGFAPKIDLILPPGWIAGPLQWPAPERHLSEGDILDHVYYHELVLLQNIEVPVDAASSGAVTLTGNVEWLACKESCVPGKTPISLEIPLSDSPNGPRSAQSTAAFTNLPQPLPNGLLDTRWEGQNFLIQGPADVILEFMPTVACGELVNIIRDGQGPELALQFQVEEGMVGPVQGLITITNKQGETRAYAVDFPTNRLNPEPSGG